MIAQSFAPVHANMRLSKTQGNVKVVKTYVAKARLAIVHQAAARAWSHGVPWADALKVATKAVEDSGEGLPRALPKAHAKSKGRGKGGQGRGRGSA